MVHRILRSSFRSRISLYTVLSTKHVVALAVYACISNDVVKLSHPSLCTRMFCFRDCSKQKLMCGIYAHKYLEPGEDTWLNFEIRMWRVNPDWTKITGAEDCEQQV